MTPSGLGALEALLHYVGSANEGIGDREMREALREAFPEQGERLMANVAEKWIEKGIEQGSTATASSLEAFEEAMERGAQS